MGLPAAAPGTVWRNLGPTDGGPDFDVHEGSEPWQLRLAAVDSGRVNQIVPHPLDPNTIFVATAEGGLWRTRDAGTSWMPLTEALPSLALGALAIDPKRPSILIVGLGDIQEDTYGGTGVGIVRSEDSGVTWGQPVTLGTSTIVTSILVLPESNAVVLVGTNAGLFRSTDAGKSYGGVVLPPGNPPTIRDVTWTGGSTVLLTTGNNFDGNQGGGGANILVSSDAGATWLGAHGLHARPGIRRFSIAVAPSDRRIAYALAASTDGSLFDIYRSSDRGRSWRTLEVRQTPYANPLSERGQVGTLLGKQGGYSQIAVVSPDDPNIAFFGGNFNLVRTTDGGSSFRVVSDWAAESALPYVHADFQTAAFDRGGALWIGHDGGVARSTDGGTTWSSDMNRGLTTHLVYAISSSPSSRDAVIAGMQDNGCRIRLGATSAFPQRIYADGFGVLLHPQNANLILGSVYYTRILKSTDGGLTFRGSYVGIPEANDEDRTPFFTRIASDPRDPNGNTVYTFTNHNVYRSTDFGDSWQALGAPDITGPIRQLAVAGSASGSLGLITGVERITDQNLGRLYLSTDSGLTWNGAAPLPGSAGALSNLAFHPTDSRRIYVASVAPDRHATHLWRSADSGNTWAPIDMASTFPKGVPVNVVIADPVNRETLYAGTHLGLYRSTDDGAGWERFGTGLPLVSVTDIWVAPDSSLLRVGTFGRGIWELQQ